MAFNDDDSLSKALIKLSDEVALNDENLELRRSVLSRVNKAIFGQGASNDSEMRLSLYGSSLTGAGLKDCNIDIYLESTHPEVMIYALEQIKLQSNRFTGLQDYLWKTPARFHFKDVESALVCTITYDTREALQTSMLIRRYFTMSRRALILARCFRYWAKVCEIDRENEGTLNPCCFSLMLIHFLQKKHVLPVFDGSLHSLNNSGQNKDSLGKLWIGLLRYYEYWLKEKEFVVCIDTLKRRSRLKKWYSHAFAIEDPCNNWKNLAHSLSKKVVDYFKNCFAVSSKYFEKTMRRLTEASMDHCETRVRQRTATVNDSELEVLSINSSQSSCESDDESEENYISDKDDDEENIIFVEDDNSESPDILVESDEGISNEKDTSDSSDSNSLLEQDLNGIGITCKNPEKGARETRDHPASAAVVDCPNSDHYLLLDGMEKLSVGDSSWYEIRSESTPNRRHLVASGDAMFIFDKLHLCGRAKRPIFCCICKSKGHLKKDCPTEKFDIRGLSPLSTKASGILSDVCQVIMRSSEYSASHTSLRRSHLERLQRYITKEYPDAHLALFGSSNNGFGFRNSDMDICMVLDGKSASDINPKSLIDRIGKLLRRCNFVRHVSVIRNAKVPIAKFVFIDGAIDADISLYNLLALENTKLLLAYCQIDHRVRLLGYTLKFFAKACSIGDASRGTLSSYAYIIMLIHFLQQRKPAVLPVLQELFDAKSGKPRHIIDGWNAWFFKDINALSSVWLDHGKNQESPGELWFEFFRYYVEEFDFNNYVVSIRQSKPLRKFQKSWNRFPMAIEDPFKLEHNLAAGITPKVFRYIFNILINGRNLYSMQVQNVDCSQLDLKSIENNFFHVPSLVKELVMPQDRLCRKCGKIGHTRKNCTLKKMQTEKSNITSKDKKMDDETGSVKSKHEEEKRHEGKENFSYQRGNRSSSSTHTEGLQPINASCAKTPASLLSSNLSPAIKPTSSQASPKETISKYFGARPRSSSLIDQNNAELKRKDVQNFRAQHSNVLDKDSKPTIHAGNVESSPYSRDVIKRIHHDLSQGHKNQGNDIKNSRPTANEDKRKFSSGKKPVSSSSNEIHCTGNNSTGKQELTERGSKERIDREKFNLDKSGLRQTVDGISQPKMRTNSETGQNFNRIANSKPKTPKSDENSHQKIVPKNRVGKDNADGDPKTDGEEKKSKRSKQRKKKRTKSEDFTGSDVASGTYNAGESATNPKNSGTVPRTNLARYSDNREFLSLLNLGGAISFSTVGTSRDGNAKKDDEYRKKEYEGKRGQSHRGRPSRGGYRSKDEDSMRDRSGSTGDRGRRRGRYRGGNNQRRPHSSAANSMDRNREPQDESNEINDPSNIKRIRVTNISRGNRRGYRGRGGRHFPSQE